MTPQYAIRWTIGTAAVGLALAACGSSGSEPGLAVPVTISADSGAGQHGEVGLPLSQLLVVLVKDGKGNAVANVRVVFGTNGSGSTEPTSAQSDAQGHARTRWTLGKVAGEQAVTATVTRTDGAGLTTTFHGTANAGPVDTVTVSSASLAMLVGDTVSLSVALKDRFGNAVSGVRASWSSSDVAVATVADSGSVIAIAPGSAVVIASSGNRSTSITVSVTNAPVVAVDVTPAAGSIAVGDVLQLVGTPKDSRGRSLKRSVTWTTHTGAIATIDSSGVMVGVSPGTASIAASAEGKSASAAIQVVPRPLTASARQSLDYLARVMDQYHTRYTVYADVSEPGNHFHAWAKLPGASAPVRCNGSSTVNIYSGATAIRCEYLPVIAGSFGGMYFQNGVLLPDSLAPIPNFGTYPNAGIDLSGATALKFRARGARGGEVVDFFMGGVGRDATSGAPLPGSPYPESSPVVKQRFTLTSSFTQFSIDLAGRDLHYALGGFGWVASDSVVFDVDDIYYELTPARQQQRLAEPRLLRSFETRPVQPDPFDSNARDDFDLVLRGLAFSYDNAVALLAFLAGGTAADIQRAELIGRAFVYATLHDRTFTDGRVRTAVAPGDLALPLGWTPNGLLGTVPVSGFYSDDSLKFYEVEQQASDVGNEAWVMIALLALYRQTSNQEYLQAARRLGLFIMQFRNDAGTYQGFLGGIDNPEGVAPSLRRYASTEHNLDVYAAFTAMYNATNEPLWRDGAEHARAFVETMWDDARQCYLAGTLNPTARNALAGQLPVDVQVWSLLALTPALAPHPESLSCAATMHRTTEDGITGYDFNDDRDGVWFEGTAHVGIAAALTGKSALASSVRQTLVQAQNSPLFGGGGGIVAAGHDGVTSGFAFSWYRRLHISATAWNVLAQQAVNPFFAGLPR